VCKPLAKEAGIAHISSDILKGACFMDLTVVEYIGFVVAALILIWAVIEINKRLYRHDKFYGKSLDNWVELDTKRSEAREELPPKATIVDDDEDEIEAELHTRARQNGHHAESQKPQI
jgi:hypothetical protein